MNFGSILDQEQSAFQFKSVFKYTRVPSEEEENRFGAKSTITDVSLGQKIARKSLVFALYSAFLISLPVSVWFCIKVSIIQIIFIENDNMFLTNTICTLLFPESSSTRKMRHISFRTKVTT